MAFNSSLTPSMLGFFFAAAATDSVVFELNFGETEIEEMGVCGKRERVCVTNLSVADASMIVSLSDWGEQRTQTCF